MKTVAADTILNIDKVSVVKKSTQILCDVQFSTCSGEFMAIMGPSGAGKTTLLNVIAGRQPLTSGEITLSGKLFGKQLRRRLGFVLQQDIFLSRLTLWETLYFTAMIRLPESIPHAEKMKRLNEIIDMLDIRKCINTVIGDVFLRGLSDGEKKRASIACELLTDPDILLCDEPTSGLDSSTALSLVKQLKIYARQYNKTVIITIHQPSSQIYHMFDSLLLIALGQVVYFGVAHNDPLDFLKKFGYPCDPLYNPADFMLEVLKSDKPKIDELVSANRQNYKLSITDTNQTGRRSGLPGDSGSIRNNDTSKQIISRKYSSETTITLEDIDVTTVNISRQRRWPTSFITQFQMLCWRNFKQCRGRILHMYDIVHFVLLTSVAGILFYQIPKANEVFRDRMGLIYFCVVSWTFIAANDAILAFPAELGVVSKERASGAYRLSSYYFAKTVSELPLVLVLPTLCYTFVYWMAGLSGVREFFITCPIFILSILNAQGIGLFFGATITDIKASMLTANAVLQIGLLFSCFYTQTFPSWLFWGKYISIVHYPLSAMSIFTFEDMLPIHCNLTSVINFPKCLHNSSELVTSEDVLQGAGITLPVYCYIGTLMCVVLFGRVGAYIALRLKITGAK